MKVQSGKQKSQIAARIKETSKRSPTAIWIVIIQWCMFPFSFFTIIIKPGGRFLSIFRFVQQQIRILCAQLLIDLVFAFSCFS